MAGKICMITGGNSGIGKETAVALARMGAKVVIVCRSSERAEVARLEIISKSGAKGEDVTVMIADLASLGSVRKLAADYLGQNKRLDVLVNNAGLILGRRSVTEDGLETTFEVNYLSHFLLTNLLLDAIIAASPSRIVNVSSSAHLSGHVDFEDLQGAKRYGGFRAYSQSKLAQVLFTRELSRRLQGTGVTVNSVHPGVVATNWARHHAGALSIGVRLGSPFMASPAKGARTSVFLASSPDVAGVTGRYFADGRETESSDESNDDGAAQRLWKVSLALAGLPEDQGKQD